MFILQILIGIVAAVGIGFVLADLWKVPSIKATRAAESVGKKGNKRTSVIEMYLGDFSVKLAGKLRLNEYKRAQLEADLKTAGMNKTPEQYTADAIVKALVIGVLAIPTFFLARFISFVVIALAAYVYFREIRAVSKKIKKKRDEIEYELPRFVSVIEKSLAHTRDVIGILDGYKERASDALRSELEITVADMRSGNNEAALRRLESRIGSTMMSDVVRGLISVDNGNDTSVYFAQLDMKFADHQRETLKLKAAAVPRRVKRLSFALLGCFIIIYGAVIVEVLSTSMSALF